MKHPQEHHNYSAEVVDEINGNDEGDGTTQVAEEVTKVQLVSNAVDQLEKMKYKAFHMHIAKTIKTHYWTYICIIAKPTSPTS